MVQITYYVFHFIKFGVELIISVHDFSGFYFLCFGVCVCVCVSFVFYISYSDSFFYFWVTLRCIPFDIDFGFVFFLSLQFKCHVCECVQYVGINKIKSEAKCVYWFVKMYV